ncbi:hypothetical protein [Thermovibrio ammonificans]|uniref:Uncharacterized protein n=1 Tax=Thermovibrio ammonificans (strain DSM 15698 / JCM 12110 / HB-1) TaxID=648996 RepID=E8T679_THEA1|nr:hypothetical protein [Thermovibrio ammonificans]ADU96663.1 hypothetical protein Theam_0695 [Thermovibrio ammonificans HB-1]
MESRRGSAPAALLILIAIASLVLGWAIGEFFTGRTVAKVLATIPGSPIVLDAKYDKEHHSIVYSILNPGGTPLTIVDESFVFTPGNESKEKAYVVSHVPVHIVLPPGVATKVELKLKPGTEKLHIGDAVLATFTYVQPLSNDLYTVIHPFKMGMKPENLKEKAEKKAKGGK